MFDQYGFAILSTSSPVAISLVNGTLLGTASATVLNGAASFSGLTASQLIPDASGNVYLKASYGSAYGMSSPIPASIIDAPNTTVAGYLDYNLNTKASPADRAPAPGKTCSLYVDGKQYDAVTDANGFYKIDARVNSVSSIARLSATGPSGVMESTEILLSPSKLYAALASFSAPGEGRLAIKDIGAFSGVIPADILKQQVDQKIAEIRSSSSGALAISGRVTQMRSSSADPIIGLSGVSLSISPGGQSAQTDANGFFTLNGPFAAAYYSITASKSGYQNDYTQLSIVTNDYGFVYGGMNLQMSKEVIVKYLYSVSISPSGAQLYTGGQFNLATVNAIANYSDGTSAPITPAWSIRSGGGSISGTYYTAPAAAGNVALTASHTENGITKSVDFIVTVSQQITLSSLILSKENDTMLINGVYDLSSIKAV
ncbi:MAG TPA: hypothetical protein PKL57_20720, partial [Candidatus Wallbacteria bacterium]|nr:hypothetical protein [Candidatus Wallbacteria bacterium]